MAKAAITSDRLIEIMGRSIMYYQKFLEGLRYQNERYSDTVWLHNHSKHRYGYWSNGHVEQVITSLTTAFSFMTSEHDYPICFLDAGCGAGNILLLAYIVGFKSVGIEIDRKTARIGRKLLQDLTDPPSIIYGDLVKYKQYGIHDVIYYYQPMLPRSKPMKKFLELLSNSAKVSALIVVDGNDPFKDDERFEAVTRSKQCLPIYRKMSNQLRNK